MREFTLQYRMGLSCEAFWNLRLDLNFDAFIADCDGQEFCLLNLDLTEDDGDLRLDRKVHLKFKESPVPAEAQGRKSLNKIHNIRCSRVCS